MSLLQLVRAKYRIEAGLSSILYHYTPPHRALSILKQNKFVLPTFLGTGSDQPLSKGKMYYLSMSRQKAGGYHNDVLSGVVFELDGRKLSQKYGGTPFDYWGPEYREAARKAGKSDQALHLDENEDRLLTDKPSIPNAADYIKSIHVLFGHKDNPHVVETFRKFYLLAKIKKLPIFFYEDQKAFLLQDRRRAVPFDQLKAALKPTEKDPPYQPGKTKNPFAGYLRIYHARKKSDVPHGDARRYLFSMDTATGLETLLHNYKSNQDTRKYVEDLLALWKKLGVKTAKAFTEALRKRYDNLP